MRWLAMECQGSAGGQQGAVGGMRCLVDIFLTFKCLCSLLGIDGTLCVVGSFFSLPHHPILPSVSPSRWYPSNLPFPGCLDY